MRLDGACMLKKRLAAARSPMKRKKLLITVGAGASVDFGLPSVSAVNTLLDDCAGKLYPLADNNGSNLYRHCREAIDTYYAGTPEQGLRKFVNFEEVLYQLNVLASYLSDDLRQHGSNALLAARPLPEVLEFNRTRKAVDGQVLRSLTHQLTDTVVDHFVEMCATVGTAKAAEIAELGQFLAALQEKFEIGIVTLNYDNVFTQALPGLHTGFDAATGIFDPMAVLTRKWWNFIYHLHGSVHFAMTGVGHDMHGIRWTATPLKNHTTHAFGRNSQDSIEGTSYPMSSFVAGYGKTQQILRQPFRTYFAQLNRLVHEADSLLFLGYGFGDLHLNAAFSEVRSRRRPIVVVDWAEKEQDSLPFRMDNWTHALFQTLPGNAHTMSWRRHVAPALMSDLKAANELEVSTDSSYPLAVWYNGLLAACQHRKKILRHLR